MFVFTKEELENWRCQFGISNDTMGLRYPPMAFSELGVAMLSSVLNSERAIQINIAIMKTFVRMRKMIRNDELTKARLDDLEDRIGAHEFQTLMVLDQLGSIKKKLTPSKLNKPCIGFPMPEKTTKK